MQLLLLERVPILVCQCVLPCFLPFRTEDGTWSDVGCLLSTGHEGDHSPDGPGELVYRDPPQLLGQRVPMRRVGDSNLYEGHCKKCHRGYSMSVDAKEVVTNG